VRVHVYVNRHHGFSVLHFSYLALRSLSPVAASYLTSQDVLALLVSSLCHDIDHPGNTNSYEINSNSDLALRHNGNTYSFVTSPLPFLLSQCCLVLIIPYVSISRSNRYLCIGESSCLYNILNFTSRCM
jgi:hypothetical protein